MSLGFGVGKPIATKPVQSGNINHTTNGESSGTAKLQGSYSVSGQTLTYNVTITFTNFSNDGVQFHQGKLTMKVTASGQSYSYTYKGTINTQGAFKATMVFDLGITSSGVYSGTIKVTSNGQTFTYNVAD